MKEKQVTLFSQLISIALLVCTIAFISLAFILPKSLLPIYEKSLYQYLKQPLSFVESDINDNIIETDIAYLYVVSTNDIVYSDNLSSIIKASPRQILLNIKDEYGKFRYLGRTYYYNTSYNNDVKKISITDDKYINNIREDMLYRIFPVIIICVLLILILIVWWSQHLIKKVEHLKEKVDNLDNDDYVDKYQFKVDDELKSLSNAIDDMRLTLKQQEEYKSQMYQNISHDFKTPLTVIKSYLEAIDDGMLESSDAKDVIKEQVNKLEQKVHSLLYLNKIDYIKNLNNSYNEKIDISQILNESIAKFKIQRPDVVWKVKIEDKKTIFDGTYDMWEAIIDNILNNFVRYADKMINVTIKNDKIIFFNDGPNIDEKIVNDIFTPYKKGIKGQFGLGLSIVKKTVALVGYEVSVKNAKKGVNFIIKKAKDSH
ncbi:MAG: HAMP domain-containing sensor histidine kinase [Bacilli bacterium]